MSVYEVDVVILTRGLEPIPKAVLAALDRQQGVHITVHRVVGAPIPSDRDRLDTIVRARNEGKRRGNAPYLMFLDDDVVLEDNCITHLIKTLAPRTRYAALAADYLGQANSDGQSRHVGMGATLFRRRELDAIQFRYDAKGCECQCCCDDLRERGYRIAYCPAARAQHLPNAQRAGDRYFSVHGHSTQADHNHSVEQNRHSGANHVLTCFDQNHLELFRRIFLPSLRASGNHELVSAVTYGLRRFEAEDLAALPGVRVFNHPRSTESPAVLRLVGFRRALKDLPSDALAAYWDAGDSVFQRSLKPLWETVGKLGDQLGVVAEPDGVNRRAIDNWTSRIRDRRGRLVSYRALSPKPMLNGGFAAGKASVLLEYLHTAPRLLNSWLLRGTGGFDQNALNMYCHHLRRPHVYLDEGWNFCLFGRKNGSIQFSSDSQILKRDGMVIPVVHGNAGTLVDLNSQLVKSLAKTMEPINVT